MATGSQAAGQVCRSRVRIWVVVPSTAGRGGMSARADLDKTGYSLLCFCLPSPEILA